CSPSSNSPVLFGTHKATAERAETAVPTFHGELCVLGGWLSRRGERNATWRSTGFAWIPRGTACAEGFPGEPRSRDDGCVIRDAKFVLWVGAERSPMIRTIAALALACCVGTSALYAQDLQFVVRAESAGVHRSPSTGSPIIGHAPRGTVLQVTRELGSWVRITWPASPDGVAYVHVSLGTLSRHDASPLPSRPIESTPVAARSAQSPAPAPAPVPTRRVEPSSQPVPVRASYVRPPAHAVGIGAWIGAVHPGF